MLVYKICPLFPCEIQAGDFFVSVSRGADAYLLQHVIHDWNDQQSVTILRHCRDAMKPGARLRVIEQIMPERMQPNAYHQDVGRRDLNMLVGPGAQERTAAEYRRLLADGGCEVLRVVPVAFHYSVIEAATIKI